MTASSPCSLAVPAWALAMVTRGPLEIDRLIRGADADFVVHRQAGDGASLISVTLPGARQLSEGRLREQTRRVYDIHRELAGNMWHPVRVWNFIPGITEPMRGGLDRYMAFNLGRHDAVGEWFGHHQADRLPAASGVGHAADDLVVHMLSLREPPFSVENPRQRPAFRYSKRFGPKPPCFSRASLVATSPSGSAGGRTLLVAGTASILGDRSQHMGSIRGQIEETFANLRALIGSAVGPAEGDVDPVRRFENVRAYSPDPAHDAVIAEEFAARLGGRAFEIVRADLCRAELLVEIEGTASMRDDDERVAP